MSGTKVTTDPLSQQQPKIENPGAVTSDSLAGESIREGGSFAADSKSRGVLEQPSSSTTTNTTDTSNATKLDPAHSRADRADGISAGDRAEGFGGAGTPSLNSGPFNPGSKTTNTAPDAKPNPAHSRADRADGISAGDRAEGFGGAGNPSLNSGPFNPASKTTTSNPKGNGLQEGGDITGKEPNASFNGDIGGKNDPGRAAVQKIVSDNAATAGTTGERQTQLDKSTPYDALGGSTSA